MFISICVYLNISVRISLTLSQSPSHSLLLIDTNQVVELSPLFSKGYYYLCLSLIEMGDFDEATAVVATVRYCRI